MDDAPTLVSHGTCSAVGRASTFARARNCGRPGPVSAVASASRTTMIRRASACCKLEPSCCRCFPGHNSASARRPAPLSQARSGCPLVTLLYDRFWPARECANALGKGAFKAQLMPLCTKEAPAG